MVVEGHKDHPKVAATTSRLGAQTPPFPLAAPPAAVFSGALIGGVILGYAVGPLWTIVGTVAGIAIGEFFAHRSAAKSGHSAPR